MVATLVALAATANFVLSLSLAQGQGLSFLIFRLGVGLVIAFALVRGYGWARSYVAFGFLFSAILIVIAIPAQSNIIMRVWLAVVASVYLGSAWLVWSSKKVEAYCEARDRERNPPITMSEIDSV